MSLFPESCTVKKGDRPKCCKNSRYGRVVLMDIPENWNGMVFVGEAPGVTEDSILTPFVGPAGNLARKTIKSLGIDPDQVYWDNIVKCIPYPAVKGGGTNPPSTASIKACNIYLKHFLREHWDGIKVIVGAGGIPASFLMRRKITITKEQGSKVYYLVNDQLQTFVSNMPERGFRPLVLTTHPSYILHLEGAMGKARSIEALNQMKADLSIAAGILRKG